MDSANTPTPTTNVIVYSSPTCGFCHMAMDYFKNKHIPFIEKDISTDQEALHYVLEKVGQAVTPIITIGETTIVGFDRPKIDEALEANIANKAE
jgi:glutaredoxin 3